MSQHHNADAGLNANNDDELIDATQASREEFHGFIQPSTIRSWRTASRGQPLPFVVLGRRRLYRRRDIRAFIAAQTHGAAL